jgi:branched-chain amino acid transport system substrate-binding protein
MKRTRILLVAALLVSIIGCNPNRQKKNETIKIGAILPLTGGAAFVGVPIKNAIQLKVDEFNITSPNKIEVIFEDSKADVKEAVSALEKLRLQGIKVVLGPATSGEVLGLASVAEKNKIVLLSPSASAKNISNAGDYIFRNELSDDLGATIQAQLAYNKLQWRKVSILYTENDYGTGVKDAFETEFKKLGGEVLNEIAFKGGTADFKTHILRLKSLKSEAVFVIAQAEYPLIVRQFVENDFSTNIYATPVFEDQSFIDQIGKDFANGIIYTYYGSFNINSDDNIISDFVSAYKYRYQSNPSYYAALGYDNICIMIEALTSSNFDVNKVKSNLYLIQNFNGVTGNISFDKNGDVSKPVILKLVRDGKFTNYN